MTLYRLAISALFIFSSIAAAQAKTVWVDDQLYLPVRSGAGSQYRIIENAVPSGTPLEVIETSDTGYTRVRTAKGNDGWVSSQYISNTPIAADRLKTVSRQLEQAKTELSSLKGQLKDVSSERDALSTAESSLSTRSDELQQELRRIKNIASNSINLERRNRELLEENQKLRNDRSGGVNCRERATGSQQGIGFHVSGCGPSTRGRTSGTDYSDAQTHKKSR